MTDSAYIEIQELAAEITRRCIARDMAGAYKALLAKRALQAALAVMER